MGMLGCKSAGLRLRRFESYLPHRPLRLRRFGWRAGGSRWLHRRCLFTAEAVLGRKAVGKGGLS
jgi:hypothetical protein